ncbi:MAG: FAD-dependent oxidoreductase, partial [Pseudomonadota bacterium]
QRRAALGLFGGSLLSGFVPWTVSAEGHRLRGYIRTNWSHDPFAFGSYSYVASGATQRDRQDIEMPFNDRVFFAGEAVFPKYNSTVHAAYESGRRTASFVLDQEVERVAVVGAGISGLAAAQQLAGEGMDVTVYEARSRLGGRIWTDDSLGWPLDLGASWIHGTDGNPLIKLADAVKNDYIETDESFIIRGKDGQMIAEQDAPTWLENVVSVQHTAGADYEQINVSAYWFQRDYDGGDVKFPGGYAGILSALKGAYEVRLSMRVTGITQTDNGVALSFAANDPAHYDAVVVTLPLGVLKQGSVHFLPPLPQHKLDAINRLGMGTLDKVYLLFEEAFWDQDTTWIATPENGLPPGQFNQWLNLYKYFGAPVIMAFNGGPPALALANLSDADLIGRGLQTLNAVYPS